MNLLKRQALSASLPMLLACGMGFMGCERHRVEDVVKRLRSPEYVRGIEIGDHKVEFRYVPTLLRMLTNPGVERARLLDKKLLDSLNSGDTGELGLLFQMTLAPRVDSLRPTDFRNDVIYGPISGHQDYRDALQEFSTGLRGKIWLEMNGQRLELQNYLMTNTWGLTKSRSFMLLFPIASGTAIGSDLELVAEDLVPGMGREKFSWTLPVSRHEDGF